MTLFPDMRSFLLLTFQSKLPVRSPAHSNLKIDEFIQKVRKMSDQAGLTFKVAELLLDELRYQEIILQIQHHSLIKTKIKNPLNFVMAIKMSLGIPDNTDKKFVVWKRNYYSLKQSILTLMSLEYESFHTTHQSIQNLVHHFFKNPAVQNTLKLTSVDTLNIIKRMYQQSERMFTQGILKTKPSFYLHKKLEYYFNTNIHIQTLEEGLHGIFPNLGERMAILDSLTKYLQSSIHHNNYWGIIERGNTTYNKQLENILILGRNEGLSLQKCYDFIKTMVLNAQQDEVEQEYTILLEQLQSILTMKPPRNLMIHLISPSTPEIEGFSVIKQMSA